MQTTPYTAEQAMNEAAKSGTIGEPIRTWKSGWILVEVNVPGRWKGKVRCLPEHIEAARKAAH